MKIIETKIFNLLKLLIFGIYLVVFSSCGFYSYTGASIPADAKTVSVAYISNFATIVAPSLSQTLTEKLKTKIINESQLKLASTGGDLHFSGRITDYKTAPVAVQGNQQNAINRLTVVVEISFVNEKDKTKNFTQAFSTFVDFGAGENFSSIETSLIEKATDGLIQDIFNRAFINW